MSGKSVGRSAAVSAAVVEAVASSEGVDPVSLTTPLYDGIDPESLDRLVDSIDAERPNEAVVRFSYAGYTVAVTADGSVTLSE